MIKTEEEKSLKKSRRIFHNMRRLNKHISWLLRDADRLRIHLCISCGFLRSSPYCFTFPCIEKELLWRSIFLAKSTRQCQYAPNRTRIQTAAPNLDLGTPTTQLCLPMSGMRMHHTFFFSWSLYLSSVVINLMCDLIWRWLEGILLHGKGEST